MNAKLEVHEHCIIRGPRANLCGRNKFSHSHAGGDAPHEHPLTGPSSYTIDKDDWYRRTGLRSGGRKKFTAKPTGEQFELVAIDPADLEFDVIIDEESCRRFMEQQGAPTIGGVHAIERMSLAFGMKPNVRSTR